MILRAATESSHVDLTLFETEKCLREQLEMVFDKQSPEVSNRDPQVVPGTEAIP